MVEILDLVSEFGKLKKNGWKKIEWKWIVWRIRKVEKKNRMK